MAAIEVRDLTRRFGDLVAVDRVSFEVKEGEVFGFLGPNGAGKTTTVRMLTGVIDPTAGSATIRGHDIRREPLLSSAHIAVVPEMANVYLDLSVWQNVMLMGELYGVPRGRRVSEGQRLLEELGLEDRRKHRARELSKGLRQRLMLCAALVTEPEVLFLDEPTSGLDVKSARLIRHIVSELNREGLTVFLTTHNMPEANDICDRVAIIDKGRIAAIDTPGELRSTFASRLHVEVRFAVGGPGLERLESIPTVTQVESHSGSIRLYTREPWTVLREIVGLAESEALEIAELATGKPSLEDVFLYLTGERERTARE